MNYDILCMCETRCNDADMSNIINVMVDKGFDIVYNRCHQTFFTEGRITERMTSEGRIIIPFNTCKPERKLWEKKTTN